MNTANREKEKVVGTQLGRVIGDGGGGASADHLRTKFSRQQQTKAGGLSAEMVEKAKEGSWLAVGGGLAYKRSECSISSPKNDGRTREPREEWSLLWCTFSCFLWC